MDWQNKFKYSMFCVQVIETVGDAIPKEMQEFLNVENILEKLIDRLIGTPIDRGSFTLVLCIVNQMIFSVESAKWQKIRFASL